MRLYFVSRPVTTTSQPDPAIPFGLLALDPATRTFTLLVEQAVFAQFNPDQSHAFVVFPAKRPDGALPDSALGLDGGIFNLNDQTLVGRVFVSDRLLYANPAEGDLVPVAWSNDGSRLVFGDSQGNLTLLNVDGTTQVLATGLPTADVWPQSVHYSWSPDAKHIAVQYGEQAWVVDIP